MRGVFVLQLGLACGVALTGGCGGTATGLGQTGGTWGNAASSGGTDGTGDGTGGTECVDGAERCPCYGDGTCNEGLVCASDLCVDLGGIITGSGGEATGGTGGEQTSCSNATPCGGDVVGTWNVTSSCLTVSGDLSVWYVGLDRCESVPVTGSLEVTGTWTANADGTYSDNTTTTGTETLELLGSCLRVDATCTTCSRIGPALASLGYASVTCEEDPNSDPSTECGLGCTCAAIVDQAGGLGVAPMDPSASGTYAVAGSTLIVTAGEQEYSHCVSGSTVTLTPQSVDTTGTLTGTVVLQKQ